MSDAWIVIPKWDNFQHRDMARSSVPPWVKMYTRLLSDDDYLGLSHHQRGVLMGIWLEYARSTRQLRGSTATLTRRLGQRVTTRDLTALNHAGFIGFSASKPASGIASLEVEVEVEVQDLDLGTLVPGPVFDLSQAREKTGHDAHASEQAQTFTRQTIAASLDNVVPVKTRSERVLEACGITTAHPTYNDEWAKAHRATKNAAQGDIIAAIEAANGPGVNDKFAVALKTLANRNRARRAAA